MDPVLLSRSTLAERWDFSVNAIIAYEQEGVLTRNPNFKVPRYYMEEILKIEALKEVNPLSPLERKRLEKRVTDLETENAVLKDKLTSIRMII